MRFGYEPIHNRLEVFTDALGHETRFAYDPTGNLTSKTYADGSIEQFVPDGAGNVVR